MRGFGLARTGGRDRRAAGATGCEGVPAWRLARETRARQGVAHRVGSATLGRDCGISTVGGEPGGASSRSREQSVSAHQWLISNLPAGRIALGEIRT